MKKSLILLALAFNPSLESFSQESIQGAEIESLVSYEHPRARKVGELMPQHIKEETRVSLMDIFRLNKITGLRKVIGVVLGYDRDGDFIPEYEFMNIFCYYKNGVKTYAVFDVPHKLLYIDSSRDKHIDSIVEYLDIESKRFPMLPIKCKKEK